MSSYSTDARFYTEVEDDIGTNLGSGARDKLGTLRSYRRDADYEISTDLPAWKPQQAIALAQEIVRVLSEKFSGGGS